MHVCEFKKRSARVMQYQVQWADTIDIIIDVNICKHFFFGKSVISIE